MSESLRTLQREQLRAVFGDYGVTLSDEIWRTLDRIIDQRSSDEDEIERLRTQLKECDEAFSLVLQAPTVAENLELTELKRWASDACELLHELVPKNTAVRRSIDERMLDLLRRMENP